ANVKRVCYQGDVGLHVAKAIWGIKKEFKSIGLDSYDDYKIYFKTQNIASLLGQAYANGAKAFEEDPEAKEEIIAINKKVYNRSEEEINIIYDLGKDASLGYFEKIY